MSDTQTLTPADAETMALLLAWNLARAMPGMEVRTTADGEALCELAGSYFARLYVHAREGVYGPQDDPVDAWDEEED